MNPNVGETVYRVKVPRKSSGFPEEVIFYFRNNELARVHTRYKSTLRAEQIYPLSNLEVAATILPFQVPNPYYYAGGNNGLGTITYNRRSNEYRVYSMNTIIMSGRIWGPSTEKTTVEPMGEFERMLRR